MAGLGAAMYTGNVQRGDTRRRVRLRRRGRRGDRGRRARRRPHDHRRRPRPRKLEWAKEFGATHTVNAVEVDPVEAVQALTDGNGADVCIEAVGHPEVMEQAFFARDLAGTRRAGRRAQPDDDDRAADDRVLRPGRRAEAELVRRLPAEPRLPDADRPLPRRAGSTSTGSSSETIPLDGVEEAFHRMERGEVLRSVVVL